MLRPVTHAAITFALPWAVTSCTPFGGTDVTPASDAAPAPDASALDGGGTTSEAGAPPASCADLLHQSPTLAGKSGKYVVASGAVYCDMTTDGGGWTMIGRSAAGGTGAFGWSQQAGSIDDDTKPYSYDLLHNPFPFTDILIGGVTSGKTWGPNAFKVPAPPGFVVSAAKMTVPIAMPAQMAVGTCKPTAGRGWMFNFMGLTDDGQHRFWFCDQTNNNGTGLLAGGWNLAAACCGGNDCDRSAELQGKQGMIFVR